MAYVIAASVAAGLAAGFLALHWSLLIFLAFVTIFGALVAWINGALGGGMSLLLILASLVAQQISYVCGAVAASLIRTQPQRAREEDPAALLKSLATRMKRVDAAKDDETDRKRSA